MNLFTRLKSNSIFRKIFIYFILAVTSAFFFSLITTLCNAKLNQDKVQLQYKEELSRVSGYLHTSFEEINKTSELFSISKEVNTILTENRELTPEEFYMFSNTMTSLQKFKLTKSYIHSVFLISPSNNIVINSDGSSYISEYFDVIQRYSNYDLYFWLNLPASQGNFQVLGPTYVTNSFNSLTTEVIPTIQYATDERNYVSTLVVNIKKLYIEDLLEVNAITPNNFMFIYDTNGNFIYSRDKLASLNLTENDLTYVIEETNNTPTDNLTIDGNRYLVEIQKEDMLNYTYVALIPYSDFAIQAYRSLLLPLLILAIGAVVVLLLSLYFSRQIYNPIDAIITDNQRLKDEISLAVPYVCERYLLSFLNNNQILKESEIRSFLSTYNINFLYPNFMVIQSVINFSEDFFNTHSRGDYNTICNNMLNVAKEAYAHLSYNYIFSVTSNQICILLNVEGIGAKDSIIKCLQNFHENMAMDDSTIYVHSGLGLFHEGLQGLRESYHESRKAYNQISGFSNSMIRTYSITDEKHSNFYYSVEDESILFNYLYQSNKEATLNQLNKVIRNNETQNIANHAFKELYLQLYTTTIRVMNQKELSVYDLMEESYMDLSTNINDLTLHTVSAYIHLVFEKVLSLSEKKSKNVDFALVKRYLDDHCCEDIYLTMVADHFGLSSKYMSKLIRQELGVSYLQYISKMRIDRAKELLLSTGDTVADIATAVGFNNRQPFLRKFKLLEGITPTEYRKLYSK